MEQQNCLVILLMIASLVFANPPQVMEENPEMKKLSHEIQEKVCSGQASDLQLNELSSCLEIIKSDIENRDKLTQDIHECLQETETEIDLVVEEQNKEAVHMICNGRFRVCMGKRIKHLKQQSSNPISISNPTSKPNSNPNPNPNPNTNPNPNSNSNPNPNSNSNPNPNPNPNANPSKPNVKPNTNSPDANSNKGSNNNGNSNNNNKNEEDQSPLYGRHRPKNVDKFQKVMECKRAALEL